MFNVLQQNMSFFINLLGTSTFLFTTLCNAQEIELNRSYKDKAINLVMVELQNRYVFPEKAEEINTRITELNKNGYFKKFKNTKEFAKALTEVIYGVTKDKHISVSLKKRYNKNIESEIPPNPFEEWLNGRLEERKYYRKFNANFKTIDKKEGNVGYLDLRGFYGLDFGKDFANYAMSFLSTSDAIIIDLRNNSGGRGEMVRYLLGHFFDEPIITGKSIKRIGDNFIERTEKSIKIDNNSVMPNIPLYILISNKTFSAAEAFSYPLKVYQRATFIGELTKGGANAGNFVSLNEELQIFIPDVAALPHPKSQTIFEGKGIEPDIPIKSEEALRKALEMARKAAQSHAKAKDLEARNMLIELNELVTNYNGNDDNIIVDFYKKCRNRNLVFEQWELSQLAEQLQKDKPKTARAIRKTTAVIYPNSSSAQYNYGQVLLLNKRKAEAIEYLKKALQIAESMKENNLSLYKNALAKALGK